MKTYPIYLRKAARHYLPSDPMKLQKLVEALRNLPETPNPGRGLCLMLREELDEYIGTVALIGFTFNTVRPFTASTCDTTAWPMRLRWASALADLYAQFGKVKSPCVHVPEDMWKFLRPEARASLRNTSRWHREKETHTNPL